MKLNTVNYFQLPYLFQVCNHPELFERRDAKSPISVPPLQYVVPRLVYNDNVRQILMFNIQKYFVFTPEYIANAIDSDFTSTLFNFCFALNLSFNDLYEILQGHVLHRQVFNIIARNIEY